MIIETIEYRGYNINVYSDESPESPREWDNLGTMVCFHNRYNLGDKHNMDIEELKELAQRKCVIALPLYLYDHSGLTMRTTPFSCPWDSGQVGYIYVTKEKVLKEFNRKRVNKPLRQRVEALLKCEIETYDLYLTGQVYGFSTETPQGDCLDSCYGFYGDDEQRNMIEEAKKGIDSYIAQLSSNPM